MKEIAGKVSLIQDFAYQIDLLVLNAMIEAGRMGEVGNGFTVVANSARSLAEDGQIAAKEISGLAENSLQIAEEAGQLVQGVVPNIQETAKLIQEIASASEDQAKGVNEINEAMKNLMGRQAKAVPHQRNWPPPPMNSTKWSKKLKAKFQNLKVNKIAHAAIKNLQ
jgi:methyl-accepting chemotaxis protein